MIEDFKPGDKVVGPGGILGTIVKKNKSGLYQVKTWLGLRSHAKHSLYPYREPKPVEPPYIPSREALEAYEFYPDNPTTRAMMRQFDKIRAGQGCHYPCCDCDNGKCKQV